MLEVNYLYLKLIIHAPKRAPERATPVYAWISNILFQKLITHFLKLTTYAPN